MRFKQFIPFFIYSFAVIIIFSYYSRENQKDFEEISPYSHYYSYNSEFSTETEEIYSYSLYTPSSFSMQTSTKDFTEPIETNISSSTTPETETSPVTDLPENSELPVVSDIPETVPIQFPVELNHATFDELCAIPEIGTVTAQKIIDFRDEHQGFLNLQQLLEISGIGEQTYQTILPYLYLENEYFPPESEISETLPEVTEFEEEPPPEITEPPEIPIINLNTATKEQLLLLPECDETLAESILTLRDRDIHIFHHIDEITFAENVTIELYLLWKPYLAVADDGSIQIPYERPLADEENSQ